MFPWKDGTPFNWEQTESEGRLDEMFMTGNMENQNIQLTRDPRLYEEAIVNGDVLAIDWSTGNMSGRDFEAWIGGYDAQQNPINENGSWATGYAPIKFLMNDDMLRRYVQWPSIRLSEMYLIYAEALAQTGNLSKAIEQVDIVRARVGLGGLAECNPDKNLLSDSDALLEEILRERACELGFEDVRLFDMIRYKRADLFQRPLHGLRIYRLNDDGTDNTRPWSGSTGDGPNGTDPEFGNTHPNKPTKFRYETFQLRNIERSWWTNFSPKWYLSAFPPSEVNKGFGLTQNPGWN